MFKYIIWAIAALVAFLVSLPVMFYLRGVPTMAMFWVGCGSAVGLFIIPALMYWVGMRIVSHVNSETTLAISLFCGISFEVIIWGLGMSSFTVSGNPSLSGLLLIGGPFIAFFGLVTPVVFQAVWRINQRNNAVRTP